MSLVKTSCRHFAMLLFALLAGCSGYDVKLNDRVVYTPDTLFIDYQIADEALADCVANHIQTQKISSATALTELNCQNKGIKSLAGLERFHALLYVDLSNNGIAELNTLSQLDQLRSINLHHNQIENAAPLSNLNSLRYLGLTANRHLLCDSVQLSTVVERDLPQHCGTR